MADFNLRPTYRSHVPERCITAETAWLTRRTDLPADAIYLRVGPTVTHLKDFEVDQLIEGLTALRSTLGKTCPECHQVVPS